MTRGQPRYSGFVHSQSLQTFRSGLQTPIGFINTGQLFIINKAVTDEAACWYHSQTHLQQLDD